MIVKSGRRPSQSQGKESVEKRGRSDEVMKAFKDQLITLPVLRETKGEKGSLKF